MLKKKRSLPQPNNKPKKVPLITVPCLNIPEQPRMELKGGGRSIELRKTVPVNPYRKPVSRKSTCKSVKQNGPLRAAELSTIMQTFKELKLLHEQSRSKSRSPASCKSRSSKKYPLFPVSFKRKTSHTLGNNPSSEVNLTLKLERTMKQLNQTDFFRDEESLLPMQSASDLRSDQPTPHHLSSRNEEDFDLAQLRNFCSTVKLGKPNTVVQLSRNNYDAFKQNRAALKIQRAWKQFQTRRLVQRYAFLAKQEEEDEFGLSSSIREHIREPQGLSQTQQLQEENPFGGSSPLALPDAMMVQSELLYGEEGERVRQISNLQQVGSNADYEEVVKRMKMEQLQKWNQIIQIISENRSDSPQKLEQLLQLLTQQSQLNKRDLEARANQILARTAFAKQPKDEEVERNSGIRRQYSSSDHSAGLEQYDSKKYIDYLDGDIFPPHQNSSEKQDRINPSRGILISRRKQQLLLEELRSSNLPIKLGESSLYRSESVKDLEQPRSHRRQGSSRAGLRKSTSQKVLRSAIAQMSVEHPSPSQSEGGEMAEAESINLDLLTREFLEGSDPHADNFDMVYSEQKLRAKLAELSRLKEEFISEERALREGENEAQSFQRDQDELQEVSQLKRSQPSLQLHQPMPRDQIRIEDGTPDKPQLQPIEIESPSDSDEEQKQKGETCTTAIFSTLILQALKDFARSERVTETFKAYSVSVRPKRKQGKKKKGFPTSKTEIQLFLDGLLRYLNKEEPHIFRNLMVSTGPTALEMLRYMHQAADDEGEVQQTDSDQDESNVMVIPNRVFDAFWQLKEKSIVVQVPPHFDQPNAVIFKHQFQLLKSFNKIFYRSLFDTFNECLDCQRNFGQYGRPFPWKRAPAFDHNKSDTTLQSQVQKARKRMLQLSITYCGLIIEREDMGSTINQEYVKTVHQDRLSRMLASDLIEAEQRWIFYDDEQTEILVQISNALYTELLIELIEEVYENL